MNMFNRNDFLKIFFIITGEIVILTIIFLIGFKLEYPNRGLFDMLNAKVIKEKTEFDYIETINIHASNINLTIIESNINKVLVTNSVKTEGPLVFSEAKIWEKDSTLFYDQGLILNINTWDIIENFMNSNITTSGNLIVEVPNNKEYNFVIKNPDGNVNFDISSANNVTIINSEKFTFNTKCNNLTIIGKDENINIYEEVNNINISTKSGSVSLFANDETNSIKFDTSRGALNILTEKIGSYNLSGEYISLNNEYKHTIDITGRHVTVYDKNTINDFNSFFKEEK